MITTQDFLRHFGSPLVLLLPDVEGVNSFSGWTKHNTSNVLADINKTDPYWMFFTPNGNYWSLQKEGIKISRSKDRPGEAPRYNAVVVDVDLKSSSYNTMEELYAHIEQVMYDYSMGPTFIVQSWGGYHLYWLIKEEDRQAVHDLYGDKVFSIGKKLATFFDWWDSNCQATKIINGLIRVPGSKHRKTSNPIDVFIKYAHLEDQVTISMVEKYLKSLWELDKVETVTHDAKVITWAKNFTEIKNIPMPEIFAKLEKYPRTYMWMQQTFKIVDGTKIAIIDWDNKLIHTSWYRYRPAKNCINCFSDEDHPIDERPQWEVRPFLHHYFHKNNNQVKNFLATEFGVDFENHATDAVETVIQTFNGGDYFIEITDKRVTIHKTVQRWNKTIDVHDDIFKKSFEIVGKSWVKFHPNGTETDDLQMVYVMRINEELKILYRLPTKKRFNEKYSWYLWFYGEDNDLGLFYESMDKTAIPEVQVTILNGMYDDCVILGGKVIYGSNEKRFITPTFEFETKQSEDISLQEFYKKLCEIYTEEIALPIFLQTIAMAWMNVREWTTVYPAILLTWRTGSGKSSIAEIMKNMLWYAINDRKIALPQITPQPLKIMATDSSILFCDELTANVNERVEESVRNIINRDKWGRWMWAENAHYNFRAPLFFTGERTFKDESLNNRMVAVVISEKYRVEWWYDKIPDIKDYCCIKAIYEWYRNYKWDINGLQKYRADRIVKSGIKPRNADVWSYIFVVNEIFDLWYSEDRLVELAKAHLETMGFWNEERVTDEWELQMYLSKMIFQRQVQCVQETYKDKKIYRFIFMDDTIYQKARASFIMLINSLNTHGERLKISKNWLTMEIREVGAATIDFVLDRVADFILSCNYKNIQYVNRENEEYAANGS